MLWFQKSVTNAVIWEELSQMLWSEKSCHKCRDLERVVGNAVIWKELSQMLWFEKRCHKSCGLKSVVTNPVVWKKLPQMLWFEKNQFGAATILGMQKNKAEGQVNLFHQHKIRVTNISLTCQIIRRTFNAIFKIRPKYE